MEKSEKNTASSSAGSVSGGRSEPRSQFGNRPGATDWQALGDGMPTVVRARRWVEEHQISALIGAFAFGAFIGALMRD